MEGILCGWVLKTEERQDVPFPLHCAFRSGSCVVGPSRHGAWRVLRQ